MQSRVSLLVAGLTIISTKHLERYLSVNSVERTANNATTIESKLPSLATVVV